MNRWPAISGHSRQKFWLVFRYLAFACAVNVGRDGGNQLQCPWDSVATRVNSSWLSYDVCVSKYADEVTHLLHEAGFWPECEPLPLLIQAGNTDVIDVGAHVGLCAGLLCALGHRVSAFEANPRNARLLRWNAKGCRPPGSITVYEIGASDQQTGGTLFYEKPERQSFNSGTAFVAPLHKMQEYLDDHPGESLVWQRASTALSRIDTHVNVTQGKAIMKLDCQGCELLALRGAQHLFLKKRIKAILLEFDPKSMLVRGDAPMDIYYFLKQYRFQIFFLQHVDLFKSSSVDRHRALAEVARLYTLHNHAAYNPSIDQQSFAQQYQILMNRPGWSPTTLLALL